MNLKVPNLKIMDDLWPVGYNYRALAHGACFVQGIASKWRITCADKKPEVDTSNPAMVKVESAESNSQDLDMDKASKASDSDEIGSCIVIHTIGSDSWCALFRVVHIASMQNRAVYAVADPEFWKGGFRFCHTLFFVIMLNQLNFWACPAGCWS